MAPAIPLPSFINFDSFSQSTQGDVLRQVLEYGLPLVSRAWDLDEEQDPEMIRRKALLSLFILHGGELSKPEEFGPVSDLVVPIYSSFDDNSTVVGELIAQVNWRIYFESLLLVEESGITLVLENSCGQSFTFFIDEGSVVYIGQGDMHDEKYKGMEVSTTYEAFWEYKLNEPTFPWAHCLYRLRVYPSAKLEEQFLTDRPLRFSLILAGMFTLTCILFMMYDKLVQIRQKLVLSSAIMSGTVVNSLFPEEVRNRLYDEQAPPKSDLNKPSGDQLMPLGVSYLPEFDDGRLGIADLYPNCTVCFLDLVGFYTVVIQSRTVAGIQAA